MSLQTDAQECLLEAISDRNGVDVPPDEMGSVKPSDSKIGAQTGLVWQGTLENAAERLRKRSYSTREPTLAKATSLLDKVLTSSQTYLEELSRPPALKISTVLIWSGAAAATAALAVTAHHFSQRLR